MNKEEILKQLASVENTLDEINNEVFKEIYNYHKNYGELLTDLCWYEKDRYMYCQKIFDSGYLKHVYCSDDIFGKNDDFTIENVFYVKSKNMYISCKRNTEKNENYTNVTTLEEFIKYFKIVKPKTIKIDAYE